MLLTRSAAAAVVLAVVGLAVAPSVGSAAVEIGFDASVDAAPARLTVTIPAVTVADDVVDVGSARAQAALNSGNISTARAAQPFPGDLVLSVPDLVGGAAGTGLPGYPLIAQSVFPRTPRASAGAGPFTVTASSSADSSSATSVAAPGDATQPGSTAEASVKDDGAAVVARGSAVQRGISLGPVVLGGVTSSVTVTRTAAGLKRSSSIHAVKASVAGTPISVDDRGITIAGTNVKLDDVKPLQDALAEQHVTLTFLAARKTPDGVVSPGLVLTGVVPVPPNPAVAADTVKVTLVLGQVSADVAGEAFDDAVPPVMTPSGSGPAGAADPGTTAGSTRSPAGPSDTSVALDPVVAGADAGSPVLPDTAPRAGSVPASAGQQPVVAQAQLTASSVAFPGAWSTSFYLVLAGAAVLSVLVLTLVRYLGVRYP